MNMKYRGSLETTRPFVCTQPIQTQEVKKDTSVCIKL